MANAAETNHIPCETQSYVMIDLTITCNGSRDYLTGREIPELNPHQMAQIRKENIMERTVENFDPDKAIQALHDNEGKQVITLDFGGGKATKFVGTVKNGTVVADEKTKETIIKKDNGENYMAFFQKIAKEAESLGLPVAISFGGPLEGTKPIAIPNAPEFMSALKKEYDGDFAKLFPTLRVVNNDAQAGIKAAAIAVQRDFIKKGKLSPDSSIIFVINGGGFGLALLVHNKIIATEVGHVPVIDALNPYGQTEPCGVSGNHVCIERVCASGAGVESLWHKMTGKFLDGKEISKKYQEGDLLARALYDNAALIFAHGIKGVADILDIMKKSTDTALVFHGGGFRVPGLMERILQIITKEKKFKPASLYTDDISINACAEGAAIAAFYPTERKSSLFPSTSVKHQEYG